MSQHLVKIQRPLSTAAQEPCCLIYSQGRKIQFTTPYDEKMKAFFGNCLKVYCYITFKKDGSFDIVGLHPDQEGCADRDQIGQRW